MPNVMVLVNQRVPLIDLVAVMGSDVGLRPPGHVEDPGMPEMGVAHEVVAMVDADEVGRHFGAPRRCWRQKPYLGGSE